MTAQTVPAATAPDPRREPLNRYGWRPLIGSLLLPLFHGVVLASAAGRWNWPRLWAYLALMLTGYVVLDVVVLLKNPAVYNARGKRHEGSEPWDANILRLHFLVMLVMVIVTGLDAGRFGWTPLPDFTMWIGAALFVLGFALSIPALAVNPHFEPTVRVQSDRGHRVIDAGPYAVIRHPGYAAAVLVVPGAALFFGSGIALVIGAIDVALFVRRTLLEERTLRAKLPGYEEYCARVRYRWIPGVW
jgi:protein-S-isoprenylcysteine O-methyltransferase Ste14